MRVALTYVNVNVRISEGDFPVIFLHGNGESGAVFGKMPEYLGGGYKVIAPDTRGQGKSTYAPLSYDYFASDLKELIEAMHIEKPVVVGFSDGGITALKALVRYPELLGGAVLAGVNYKPEGLVRRARRLFKAAYFLTRSERMRLMLEEPLFDEKEIAEIDVPVLILAGEKDLVETKHTLRLHSLIKNSELKILKGENHSGYVRNNRRLAEEIKEFLSRFGGQNE